MSECNIALLPANVDWQPPLQRGLMNFQLHWFPQNQSLSVYHYLFKISCSFWLAQIPWLILHYQQALTKFEDESNNILLNLSNTDTKGTEQSVGIRGVHIKEVPTMGHFYGSTYSFKCSVAKTRLTLVFNLHINLLIHSTNTLSFGSTKHCMYQLHCKCSHGQISVLKQNEVQRNAACKKL